MDEPPTLTAIEARIRMLESQCHVILILSSANAFMNVATIIVAALAVLR
jgi:hypothetical protein